MHRDNNHAESFQSFPPFIKEIRKDVVYIPDQSHRLHLRSGVQGRVDKGNSEIRKVGGSNIRRGTTKLLTFWRDLHRCAFAATWLGALISPNSKQNCEIALKSRGEVAQKSFNPRYFF